jgi:hypothetical protein
LRNRARRRDHAHGVADRVAVFDHRLHRDHAHGNDRGGDGTGDGAQDGAHENHRVGQAAADRPKQLSDGVEQVLGKPAALQDRTHEGEEWDRQQEIVGDNPEQLIGEVAEKAWIDEPKFDPDEAEEQAGGGEREGRRIADQHEQHHAPEHQGRHVVAHKIHCSGFS